MGLFRKLRATLRPQRLDEQIDDEFHFHVEQRVADLMAQGMPEADARREAAFLFGNRAHLAESTRERDLFGWLQSIGQDLRFAARNLRRSPMFATVSVLSLAFGIGVNAAIFTLVDGVLLERLPLSDADRIVQVHGRTPRYENNRFNMPTLRELARQQEIFAEAIGFYGSPMTLEVSGNPLHVRAELVTGGYFRFFRARPALGRLLDDNDMRTEGASPLCVLSYEAWQSLFGGDPGVLGRTVRIRNVVLQIVGVAPRGFVGGELQNRYDLFVPMSESHDLEGIPLNAANYVFLAILGRLQPGLSRTAASARLAVASGGIEDALPKGRANSGAVYTLLDASRGYDSWRTMLHDPLAILMAAVSLVLLVACANLANLLLARAAERRQEFAIKLAIGIGRWRLMRQLLVETALLAAAGGALALLAGSALTRVLLAIFNAGNGYSELQVAPHPAVLWFTFGVCLLTVLLAGLYPAWNAARTGVAPGLHASSLHGRHGMVRRALILVQVTLAVVLLFGASLFSHSLRNLKTIDLGYRVDQLLSVQLGMKGTLKANSGVMASPELRELVDRVRHLPGVEAAALSQPGLLSGGMLRTSFTLTDGAGKGRVIDSSDYALATPGFFGTISLPILRGRDFSDADGPGAPPVAIVNQRFARTAWPGEEAIGKHLDGYQLTGVEVVGVIADSRDHDIHDAADPTLYLAYNQQKSISAALELRCRSAMAPVEAAVRDIVKTAAPDYQVARSSSLELMRDSQISQDRLLAFLSNLFGVLGATLALVGIYGLIAYSVMRRTREIGIRISVGAQRHDVLWLFLREASLLLTGGLLIGLPVGLALTHFVAKLLYHVPALDAVSAAVTAALIVAGGVMASWIPARRATRVDPASALRSE